MRASVIVCYWATFLSFVVADWTWVGGDAASIVSETPEARKARCETLEKNVAHEYDCCLSEGEKVLPVAATSWFPRLPSLTEARAINISIDQLAQLYCRTEVQKMACINKMRSRIDKTSNDCFSNDTLLMVRVRSELHSRRMRHLCDDEATNCKVLYQSEAHNCLEEKHSFLCLRYILEEGFDLEGRAYPPDCKAFRRVLPCLKDEWTEPCGAKASSLLTRLVRKLYEPIHCPDDPQEELTAPPITASAAAASRATLVATLIAGLTLAVQLCT